MMMHRYVSVNGNYIKGGNYLNCVIHVNKSVFDQFWYLINRLHIYEFYKSKQYALFYVNAQI